MAERKRVIVAGNVIVDEIKYIEEYPHKLELTKIVKTDRALGGLVCNVGIDLAKLDPTLPVTVAGYIGSDLNGELIRQTFAQYPSIDASWLWEEGRTSFTDVMTVQSTGERTFFTYKGADNRMTSEDVAKIPMDDCRLLHIGYQLLLDGMDAPDPIYGTVMARALAEAQLKGVETSLDVVSEHGSRYQRIVPPALRYVDHFAVNEMEAGKITGVRLVDEDGLLIAEHLPEALNKLREMGVRKRIVIHTPLLAAGLDENDKFSYAPALQLPKGYIVSSVGAGDAFTAALLLECTRGSSLETAMRSANAVAACSLASPGATGGVPTLDEALKLYDRYPTWDQPNA